MQIRRLAVLALVALLAACGRDGNSPTDPPVLGVDDWRVVALSGDQEARLPGSSGPSLVVRAGSAIGPDGYTDEPLVARIELTPNALARGFTIGDIPPSALVHWHIESEAGALFATTTAPDDSMYIINRYAPSTRAGTYVASAGRLVGGEIVEDARWTLTVLPGPAVQVTAPERVRLVEGETWTSTHAGVWGNGVRVRDDYGNVIEHAIGVPDDVATASGLTVTAVAAGVSAYNVLVEDTVVGGGHLYVYPDLISHPLWVAELVCETPAGTMVDRFEFVVTDIERMDWRPSLSIPPHTPAIAAHAAGLDSTVATGVYTEATRRLVIEAGDTIWDSATSDTLMTGAPWPDDPERRDVYRTGVYGTGSLIVTPSLDALVWPSRRYFEARWAHQSNYRLPALRVGREEPITGLPLLLTRDGDALSWSGEATAACASDGWPDATAGTWTVRVEG